MQFANKLAASDILILDGALATELEARGCDLNQKLWSAAILDKSPQTICDVHRAYLDAGSDCITSASYQASVPGFRAAGFDQKTSEQLYRRSIRLAFESRDRYCKDHGIRSDGTDAPLVAVSIGPYGAFLADGSEYRGNYQANRDEIAEFHASRLALAIDESQQLTDHPLLAIETVPSLLEALILVDLIDDHPNVEAWLSFSCSSRSTNCEGQSISDCVSAIPAINNLVALGVNCTKPDLMTDLIPQFAASNRPTIAYPNAGGDYDPVMKSWGSTSIAASMPSTFNKWANAGAKVIGGCCLSTPEWISSLVAWRNERR